MTACVLRLVAHADEPTEDLLPDFALGSPELYVEFHCTA